MCFISFYTLLLILIVATTGEDVGRKESSLTDREDLQEPRQDMYQAKMSYKTTFLRNKRKAEPDSLQTQFDEQNACVKLEKFLGKPLPYIILYYECSFETSSEEKLTTSENNLNEDRERRCFIIYDESRCCPGYVQRTDGKIGCVKTSLMEIMKTSGMDEFVRWINRTGLQNELMSDNFTVFAPTNEGIKAYKNKIKNVPYKAERKISPFVCDRSLGKSSKESKLLYHKMERINYIQQLLGTGPPKTESSSINVRKLLRGHIVKDFQNVDLLKNEELIDTLNSNNKIRINKYHHESKKIVTANCIPILGKINSAVNGIIYSVPAVLSQPVKSLGEIIESDSRFNALSLVLKDSDMMAELKEPGQTWTFFAPTNDVFRVIQYEHDDLKYLLRYHLVKGIVCTSAIKCQMRVTNVLGNVLHITRNADDEISVDGVPVVIKDFEDNLGTNGVIHAVQKILITEKYINLQSLLKRQRRDDIVKLIEVANLVSTFNRTVNATFFVPSKEAMQRTVMENEPELARKFLLNSLVPSYVPAEEFTDGEHLQNSLGYSVTVNLIEGQNTKAEIRCAAIEKSYYAMSNVLHETDEVLLPPVESLLDNLKYNESHDFLIKMLQITDFENKLRQKEPFTFLAPTEDFFNQFNLTYRDQLLKENDKAEEMLEFLTIKNTTCCRKHQYPIFNSTIYNLAVIALECNIPFSNGLVHRVTPFYSGRKF